MKHMFVNYLLLSIYLTINWKNIKKEILRYPSPFPWGGTFSVGSSCWHLESRENTATIHPWSFNANLCNFAEKPWRVSICPQVEITGLWLNWMRETRDPHMASTFCHWHKGEEWSPHPKESIWPGLLQCPSTGDCSSKPWCEITLHTGP